MLIQYSFESDSTATRRAKRFDQQWVSSFPSNDLSQDLFLTACFLMLSIQTQTGGSIVSPLTQKTWEDAEFVPYPKYGEDREPWRLYQAKRVGVPYRDLFGRMPSLPKEDKENAAPKVAKVPPKGAPVPISATAASGKVKEATKPAKESKIIASTVKNASKQTEHSGMIVDKDSDNLLDQVHVECEFAHHHFNISSFVEYSKAYFTPNQRKKHPDWPEHCSRCKKSFWTGEIKVKAWHCHRFCRGALNNTCNHSFCYDCFQHKLEKGGHGYVAPPTPEEKEQKGVIQKSNPNPRTLFSDFTRVTRKRNQKNILDL